MVVSVIIVKGLGDLFNTIFNGPMEEMEGYPLFFMENLYGKNRSH
jgi:hypothetical protein